MQAPTVFLCEIVLSKESKVRAFFRCIPALTLVAVLAGCGAINVGKWKGIEKTASDENFYLVKDIFLTGGSAFSPRETFDHNMHDTVSLFFMPKDEKNTYVAESRWQDPMGLEFRTIRTTYDKQEEGKKGIERPKGGATRVHTIPTSELYNHKPGQWKVALYLDGKLVRRLSFTVR
jgi:hypothetical protein